jgi:D-threo-aldose 1-dehydrogenase
MATVCREIGRRRLGSTGLCVTEIGFGAATLGNLYRPIADVDAGEALSTAFEAGLTYVDTAPFYGFGLSELRVGDALRGRQDIVVSTKVGRLLVADEEVSDDGERHGFRSAMRFRPVFDYRYDAILRSFEDSLSRLAVPRIDLLYIHDIGRRTHGSDHAAAWSQLIDGGGLRALEELRDGGAISGFGVGVNEIEACLDVMAEARLDAVLLAGRYTLLEQHALDEVLPACARSGASLIVGGRYNSGILATGTRQGGPVHYDYAPASPELIARVAAMEAVADRHDVALAAAALQFPLAHPQVASVIPGLDSADRVSETLDLYRAPIPDGFWVDLKAEGLLRDDTPVPGDSRRANSGGVRA